MTTLVRVALVGLVLATRAHAALPPGDSSQTLQAGGLERHYLLHVPASYDGSRAVPLVLDFHGLTSNASQQKAISGWVPIADREGFLLVHPDGIDNAWNAGLCCGNFDVDDVGFVRTLVATIAGEARVDASRVYATGLSNGGAISQRLACDAADLFAAAAPMAFPVPARPLSECQPSRAIPVLSFMGLVDVLVKYDGGLFPSAPDTFAFWHDEDGCRGTTPDVTVTQGASRCERYTHCTGGVEAGLCSITAKTFGGLFFDGHILYLNDDFNLAEVAWSFLSRFQLPDAPRTIDAQVRGEDRLRLGGGMKDGASTVWQVTLGDGTWSASDGAGLFLGGSARGHGRRRTLLLSTDASAVLAARLGVRAAALGGQTTDAAPRGPARLKALLGGGGHRLVLVGRLRLASGAFTVRLKGAVARP